LESFNSYIIRSHVQLNQEIMKISVITSTSFYVDKIYRFQMLAKEGLTIYCY